MKNHDWEGLRPLARRIFFAFAVWALGGFLFPISPGFADEMDKAAVFGEKTTLATGPSSPLSTGAAHPGFSFSCSDKAMNLRYGDKIEGVYRVTSPGYGSLRMEVKNPGEPVNSPYEITVKVRCRNKPERVVKQESICDFRAYECDADQRRTILHFSTSESGLGQATCDSHWTQTYDLKVLCSNGL